MKNIFSTLAEQIKTELLSLNVAEEEAAAECELIMRKVTGLSQAQRLIAIQSESRFDWQSEVDLILTQRRLRMPIQYCLGSTKFMGLELEVEPGVLIPRVDTETLVQVILSLLATRCEGAEVKEWVLAEIGVGAGPIAIALLKNLINAKMWACDISAKAIELSCRNSQMHGVSDRLELVLANWQEKLPYQLDVVVANPPYISRSEKVNLAPEIALYEPDEALFTDDNDGLSFYRSFAALLPKHLVPGKSLVAFEIGDDQGSAVRALFRAASWHEIKIHQDVNGLERVLSAVAPDATSMFA